MGSVYRATDTKLNRSLGVTRRPTMAFTHRILKH